MRYDLVEIFAVVMFFICFFGLITSKGVIKAIISILIMEVSLVMFFLSIGYRSGIMPPIGHDMENVADPLPQALVITVIIIGVAVTAVKLTMLNALYRQFKSTEWDILSKKNME